MSTPPQSSSAGAYSLFPNPNAKPPTTRRPPSRSRRSESRERSRTRAPTPGARPGSSSGTHAIDTSAPRQGRRTPQPKTRQSLESTRSPQENQQPPLEASQPPPAPVRHETPVHVQRALATSEVPPRSETAFSEAHTLVRSSSTRSRSSIAKLPIHDEPSGGSSQGPPAAPLRSIFPQYNPEVPLSQQDYFPTQLSPTHIPRAVISRTTWHPEDEPEMQAPAPASDAPATDFQPPQQQQLPSQAHAHAQPWPRRHMEMPALPHESSNDQLKNLWKVLNGWRASPSDGRVFCMKLSQEKDMPIYTLSSRQQPFYSLRIDPTSASAYVALSRHDPNKPYKGPASSGSSSSSSASILGLTKDNSSTKSTEAKNWSEVLTTTLEPETRRHRPEDGLVALLYPAAAAKIATDRPSDEQAIATAEAECARLVWDDDSSLHYLVHPSIVTPFCVTVERNPAWSRVEYTLEHHESPQHLAKLTRDGTGRGWLEVDTAVAARIDSFFVLDVAVAALLIVASGDDRNAQVETFEPPPLPPAVLDPRKGRRERAGSAAGAVADSTKKKTRGRSGRKMEEFDVDVESQVSSGFAEFKQATKETRRKLPWPLRVTFKALGGLFKCFIWCLTGLFKALAAVLIGIAKCTGLASKGG